MSLIKKYFKIILIQFALVVFILELIGLWQKSTDYFWNYRYLFINDHAYRQLESGLWTYAPNSDIRSAAAYVIPKYRSWVEYDCTFKTNKFGLIDTNFTNQKTVDWVVLGDSFTEGQGGCPWLTRQSIKESAISDKVVINGGLQGGGIIQFESLLGLIEKDVEIKNLLIIAISNDFKRGLYPENYWSNRKKCLNDFECGEDDYWWSIDLNSSHEQLLSKSSLRSIARNNPGEIWQSLNYYSFTYRVYKKIESLIPRLQVHENQVAMEESSKNVFIKNFQSLNTIKSKYPNLKIVLIPQRDEVGLLGHKNKDTDLVENYFYKNGISYSVCPLGIADYMPIDGHPNKGGYQKIFRCVEKFFQMKPVR